MSTVIGILGNWVCRPDYGTDHVLDGGSWGLWWRGQTWQGCRLHVQACLNGALLRFLSSPPSPCKNEWPNQWLVGSFATCKLLTWKPSLLLTWACWIKEQDMHNVWGSWGWLEQRNYSDLGLSPHEPDTDPAGVALKWKMNTSLFFFSPEGIMSPTQEDHIY